MSYDVAAVPLAPEVKGFERDVRLSRPHHLPLLLRPLPDHGARPEAVPPGRPVPKRHQHSLAIVGPTQTLVDKESLLGYYTVHVSSAETRRAPCSDIRLEEENALLTSFFFQ